MPKINTVSSKKTLPVLGEVDKPIKHKNFSEFNPDTIPEVDINDELPGLHTDSEERISGEKESDMDKQPKYKTYRRKNITAE